MNQKDILCMGLILLILYLLMQPTVEGMSKVAPLRTDVTPEVMTDLIPVPHSMNRKRVPLF